MTPSKAARKSRPLVDPKSFELAEHFLSDLEGDEAGEDQLWELAGLIQQAVEDWFTGIDPLTETTVTQENT